MHRLGDNLRLLAATDLSPRSDRAIDRAVQLAGAWKAHLTVLHVVSDELPRSVLRAAIAEAEQILQAQVATWRQGSVDVEHVVVKGHDYEAIIARAQKEDAKFVVMGTHRKTLLREHWFGTTVDQVVRHGDRPVLVVRQKPLRTYDKIMVAVDFSRPSRQALEFALLLFPGAQFTVLHAYDVPFKAFLTDPRTAKAFARRHERDMTLLIENVVADLKTRFGEVTCEITPVLERGFATNVVHAQVKELKPDLVVVGTHGRSGLRQALLGSVAQDLISTLAGDVLAVRARPEAA
ncbi:MAG: universal stress protein [Hyphomicrobiaceae bacterium]